MNVNTIISALSNPIRLKLLRCLTTGSKNVTELIGTCGLSQSAVSQHLAKLRQSGLVTVEKQANNRYYRLTSLKAGEIAAIIEQLEKEIRHESSLLQKK